MAIIIGIDPSLTATGIARVDTDDRLVANVTTIASKGTAKDTLAQRATRLIRLHDAIGQLCWTAHLVVIEAPAMNSRTGHQHDRSGLWWLLVANLTPLGIPVAEVTPSARAKYATGRGNAPKDHVLLEVARRYPHAPVTNNNEADALILAAMGADHYGTPIVEQLPKAHREALDKVAWPSSDLMAAAGVGVTR